MGTSSPVIITIKNNKKSIKVSEKASKKLYNSIVRIHDINDDNLGTGFFIKLNIDKTFYYFLVTTNDVITSEHFDNKATINLYYGELEDETKLQIIIEKRSKFFFYIPLEITIIEILESDNIPKENFLLPDLNYQHGYDIYLEKQLLLVGYQNNGTKNEKFISSGEITRIMRNEFEHEIEVGNTSIGSPICLNGSLGVIGIHKGIDDNMYIGSFIGAMINELEDNRKGNLPHKEVYIIKYTGTFERKLRHGKGIGYYNDGNTYEGDWVYDMKEGIGVMKYANGNKYEGEWKNDIREGKGIFYFSNGDYYKGEFKNDIIEGFGTLHASRADKDVVEFVGTLRIVNFDNDFDAADFLGHN